MKMSQSLTSVSIGNTNNRDKKVNRNRSRTYAFTLNNYTKKEVGSLSQPIWQNIKINKYCFQEEIGNEGTPHLQGVVNFKSQVEFSSLKKINKRIRWAVNKKKWENNLVYCSKNRGIPGDRINDDAIYIYGLSTRDMKYIDKKPDEGIVGWDHEYMKELGRKEFIKDCAKELKGHKICILLPKNFQGVDDIIQQKK